MCVKMFSFSQLYKSLKQHASMSKIHLKVVQGHDVIFVDVIN